MKAATAHVNLAALRANLERVHQLAPASRVMAVVKANAYGHGLLEAARALHKADAFAVARLEEALALRSGGITKPILLLEGFYSPEDLPVLATNNIDTVLHTEEQLQAVEQAVLDHPLRAWIKIDTGMHRLGVRPDQVPAYLARIQACQNLVQPVRLMSHFSCADEPEKGVTELQLAQFDALVEGRAGEQTLANSAGILAWPDSHRDWVRPGISLYGVSPFVGDTGAQQGLTPVMTLSSSLIAVREHKAGEAVGYGALWTSKRDTRLGVVAIGYGDGYPISAPEGTPVLVNGRIVPLVGRVSMDMLTVDLGPEATDQVGDEVILWGPELPVEQVADHIGTIAYELVTKLTRRVVFSYQQ